MGDTRVNESTEQSTNEPTDQGKNGFQPITSQEALDKIIGDRLARDRKNREPVVPDDYEDLKQAAARLKEIEDGEKSELQKAEDRIAALEKQTADLEAEKQKAEHTALRSTVASEKGVPANMLQGTTKEELEAFADELIQFRGNTTPSPVPASGTGDPNESVTSVSTGRERAKTK